LAWSFFVLCAATGLIYIAALWKGHTMAKVGKNKTPFARIAFDAFLS
jgi:hypothetical protein